MSKVSLGEASALFRAGLVLATAFHLIRWRLKFRSHLPASSLQKIYGAVEERETRYSPAVCIGCDMKVLSDDPDPKHISSSYVERQNLTMRMGMRGFTR